MKYLVEVVQTISTHYRVDAEGEDDARMKALTDGEREELDYNNSTEIVSVEEEGE